MFDHEKIAWPNAMFWVAVVLLLAALFYPVMLANSGREFTAFEQAMAAVLQLILATLVSWRMATATANGAFDRERQEFSRGAIRRISEIGKATERLRTLVAGKRKALVGADSVVLGEEHFAHLESVVEDIYGTVLSAIEDWVDMAGLDPTRVGYVRELRVRIEDELEEKQRHLTELSELIEILSAARQGDIDDEYELLLRERAYEIETLRARLNELSVIKPSFFTAGNGSEPVVGSTGRLPVGVTKMYRRILENSKSERV